MKALLEPIKEIARFDELFRDLKKGTAGVTVISGCLESQKAHMSQVSPRMPRCGF